MIHNIQNEQSTREVKQPNTTDSELVGKVFFIIQTILVVALICGGIFYFFRPQFAKIDALTSTAIPSISPIPMIPLSSAAPTSSSAAVIASSSAAVDSK